MQTKKEIVQQLLREIHGEEFTDDERLRLSMYYENMQQSSTENDAVVQKREEVLNKLLTTSGLEDVMEIFRPHHLKLMEKR